MPEPGREVVRDEIERGGQALPWRDGAAFARRCLALATAQFDAAEGPGPVFYDRSIIDAVVALARLGSTSENALAVAKARRYDRVFLAPPWREIFAADSERRHDFAAAVAEYDALSEAYPAWGYAARILPHGSVTARADFLEDALAAERTP